MAISEHTRLILRSAVMSERVNLRRYRQKIKELCAELEDLQRCWRLSRNAIIDLQADAGEPIEVDPSDDFTC